MRRLTVLFAVPLLALVSCGGDDDDSPEAFCDRAEAFDEEFRELESQFESDEMPTPEAFERAADSIEELAEGAPDEIEDDLRTMVEGIREVAGVLGDVDLSDPAALTDPALQELAPRMEELGEEMDTAGSNIEDYLQSECGLTFEDEE
jgi:hypothetical protein